MIWLTTLLLLAVTAWLVRSGLDEKQWVEAHSHDPDVASDQGLFKSLSAATGTGPAPTTPSAPAASPSKGADYASRTTNTRTTNTGAVRTSGDAGNADQVRQKLSSAGSEIKHRAEQTRDVLREKLDAARHSEQAGKLRESGREIGGRVIAKGSELGRKAVDQGSALGAKAAEKSAEISEKIRERRKPD